MPVEQTERHGYIINEYDLEKGFSELADELQECRFELPQANSCNVIKRNGEQQTGKRTGSNRTGTTLCLQAQKTIQKFYSTTCHKVIATERHARGYYIYALRHIII